MSLTREQLVAGVIFSRKNLKATRYQFVPTRTSFNGRYPGYIREIDGAGGQHYHVNVVTVDENQIVTFTSILGESVDQVLPLDKFEVLP